MTSEDTAVNLKGTFAVKLRANNGLNRVADYLNTNRMARVPIVGYVEFHKLVETTDGDTMTVDLVAVEPAVAADGTDVKGWGRQTFRTLDEIRVAHGKGRVADTLFVNGSGHDPELDGQLEALTREDVDASTRLEGTSQTPVTEDEGARVNASGDPVGPPSKEELDAEKREAASVDQSADQPQSDDQRDDGYRDGKPARTPGQRALEKAVVSNMTKASGGRTPRGPRTRPPATADPFQADA
jgi:hypothetical protein